MSTPVAQAKRTVAIIDGPLDDTVIDSIVGRKLTSLSSAGCTQANARACDHGTFIAALLAASRNATTPGLCPDASFLHLPLFNATDRPVASTGRLAQAIRQAIEGGAQLINLSLSIDAPCDSNDETLAAALNLAKDRGAVILAAAGNADRIEDNQLLTHPATIPVVAVGKHGYPLRSIEASPRLAAKWVGAVGSGVLGYGARAARIVMSGDSVATAISTGHVANFWIKNPTLNANDIHGKIASLKYIQQRNLPILGPGSLAGNAHLPDEKKADHRSASIGKFNDTKRDQNGAMLMTVQDTRFESRDSASGEAAIVKLSSDASIESGARGHCNCSCGQAGGTFVYALGTIDIRFPNQSISEELTLLAGNQRQKANEDIRAWYHRVLTGSTARYIARQVNWILTIENVPAYYLKLRDLADLQQIVDALDRPRGHDLDLIVGTSNLQEVSLTNDLALPVVLVEQIYSSSEKDLQTFVTPAPTPKQAAIDLFRYLVQSADNLGVGQSRALNFLAVRFAPLYELGARMYAKNYSLGSVQIRQSRLARGRDICDPIFSFRHNDSGVVQKYFVRVDLSEIYPVIVTPLQEYFDRT